MSQSVATSWSLAEFFAWQERQDSRHELVGGVPVRMMAGTSNRHDDIVVNLLGELRDQLRGTPCRPFTGDGAVETFPGQIRRPDAGVDCGPRDPNGYVAAEPRLVAEVLSPSTRDFDTAYKVFEYQSLPKLRDILLIEPNAPEVIVWTRGENEAWIERRVVGLDAAVALPSVGVTLALRDLYEGVAFPTPLPRLVV